MAEKIENQELPFWKTFYKNNWAIATIILAVLVLIILFSNITGNITGKAISQSSAEQKILEFAESRGIDAEIVSTEDLGSLYEITLSIEGQPAIVHMTKDGAYLGSMNPLTIATQTQTQSQEIPKSDKPVVELFVMTHCPYGTQAEKGIISVIEALRKTIDAKIRFVHYMMHEPEKDETPIQVCIREEQPEKYLSYLREFLKAGDTQAALNKTGIDRTKLNDCVANRAEQYYGEDSELSKGYGVQGSPTLIINGIRASSARNPASYLNIICSAFKNQPQECDAELSSETPSPGFGWEGTGSDTGAQC